MWIVTVQYTFKRMNSGNQWIELDRVLWWIVKYIFWRV